MSQSSANRHNHARLTEGSVSGHLAAMSIPMIWGILAVISINVTDTFFVGKLGTEPLAALAFTFPVVMTVMSLALGLGIGVGSVLARQMATASDARLRRLTTDSLVLALLIVIGFVVVGLLTIDPLFAALGAGPDMRERIADYMVIWYLGMPFLVVPMVGNNVIRACGDARLPSMLMVWAAIANIGLDPILIFGLGPVPAMGLEGAALASALARASSLLLTLAVLHYRMHLIEWAWPQWEHLKASARAVLHVALPAAATNMVNPISIAVVTALVAPFGAPAVAGFGVATRIESLAMIPILALTAGIAPVVGQNWGADRPDRVARVLAVAAGFCVVWGLAMAVLLALFGAQLAAVFDSQPETVEAAALYLWIVPISFAGYGLLICVNAMLNAAGRPLSATTLSLTRAFGLYVPLAWIGSLVFGLWAVFAAASVSSVLAAAFAWWRGRRLVRIAALQGNRDRDETVESVRPH